VSSVSGRVNGARWVIFNTVGTIGLLVQLACLWTLRSAFGLHYLVAAALAIELAIVHNFLWHVHWTWADRPAARVDPIRRFVRFNLTNGAISIGGNLVLMAAFVQLANMHYLVAHLLSVAVCSLANFVISDIVVFAAAVTETVRSSIDQGKASNG
jgi:putative flippase GtrA